MTLPGKKPCPECGDENYPSDAVCLSCGASLVDPPPPATPEAGGPLPAESEEQERTESAAVYGDMSTEELAAAFPVEEEGEKPASSVWPQLVWLLVSAAVFLSSMYFLHQTEWIEQMSEAERNRIGTGLSWGAVGGFFSGVTALGSILNHLRKR